MGLDMYLKAEKYIGGWKHSKAKERHAYEEIKQCIGIPDIQYDGSPSLTVSVNVAYWRKANQIHAWFVKNVQGGKDDCRDYEVSREQLAELCAVCERLIVELAVRPGTAHKGTTLHFSGEVEEHFEPGRVVTNTAIAKELLPTQSGFFFGSTDYNEGYLQDLENTVKQLKPLLENKALEDFSFSYHSSW